MKPVAAKTVAAVSFHDNHSISMDVEQVREIALGRPIRLEEGQWFCELVIHSTNGTVALQLLSDDPAHFHIDNEAEDDLQTDALAAPANGD